MNDSINSSLSVPGVDNNLIRSDCSNVLSFLKTFRCAKAPAKSVISKEATGMLFIDFMIMVRRYPYDDETKRTINYLSLYFFRVLMDSSTVFFSFPSRVIFNVSIINFCPKNILGTEISSLSSIVSGMVIELST